MSDGKATEKRIKKVLEEAAKKPDFSFERLPDAHAARGMLQEQPADFHVDCCGKSIYIEAKETENESQISIGDFPQFHRMKRKMMAGALGIVVVYHTKLRKYRIVNLKDFPLSTTVFKLGGYEFCQLSDLIWRCYAWKE